MKKLILVAFVIVLTLAVAVPAFAHSIGPCDDAGEPGHADYGLHHIAAQAKVGDIGGDGHIPGGHQGFSHCDPSGS